LEKFPDVASLIRATLASFVRHARHSGPASQARGKALVPGIYVFGWLSKEDVDGRDEARP